MKRISIRTLMAVILLSAIGLAAFRNPSNLLIELLLLTPLAAISASILGAFLQRGRDRAWSAGFALVGMSYMVITGSHRLGDLIRPHLATTHLLEYVHAELAAPEIQAMVSNALTAFESAQGSVVPTHKSTRPRYQRFLRGPAFYEHFQRVGHSLFSLFAGLLGGTVAVWFSSRWQRQEALE